MLLSRSSAKRSGLSLLEVLVAMAIFLMSFTALYHLLEIASANALEAHHRAQASRIAQSKLHFVLAGGYSNGGPLASVGPMAADDDDAGIDDGDDLHNYNWALVVNNQSTDSNHPYAANVMEIEITVTRDLPGREPIKVVLSQIVIDPMLYATSMDALLPLSSTNTPSLGYTIPNGPPTTPIGPLGGTNSSAGGN